MKTLTITYHHGHNYGAVLQAYALQQAIVMLGHENMVLDYARNGKLYHKVWGKSIKSMLQSCCMNFLIFMRYKDISRCDRGFKEFHQKIMLSRYYLSMQDLRNDVPKVDVFIVGSDQVWNLKTRTEYVPSRLLDFGPENVIRCSYAASIEKLDYTDAQKDLVKRCLARFKGISLREESARKYIEDITGYSCVRCLDPVFLLSKEQWNQIAVEPKIKEPYILCYQVQSVPGMQTVVDELKRRTGYKVVAVCCDAIKRVRTDYTIFNASPEEFLGLYKNAAVVVSASFHGTAMALVYNKPVCALVKPGHGCRIKEILHLVEMEEFIIEKDKEIPDINRFDYNKVNEILERERMLSMNYLKRMLCVNNEKRT